MVGLEVNQDHLCSEVTDQNHSSPVSIQQQLKRSEPGTFFGLVPGVTDWRTLKEPLGFLVNGGGQSRSEMLRVCSQAAAFWPNSK